MKARALLLTMATVMAACTAAPQPAASKSSASASASTSVGGSGSPAVTPPEPSPSPTPMHNPSLPAYEFDTGASGAYPPTYLLTSEGVPDAAGLSCRLPVYAGGPGSGGFVVLPDRTFVADPRSAVTVPSPPAGATPPAGPGFQGWFGTTYDKGLAKWLPVMYQWVSPDGRHYAYPLGTGIDVVDAGTSAQTVIGAGRAWQILDVGNTSVTAEPQGQPGLWTVPFSGSPTQITAGGYWQAIGGGAAYGTTTSAVPLGVATQIIRLDLSKGTTQPWFQVDGAVTSVIGFDAAGHPLMAVSPQGGGYSSANPFPYQTYVWLVRGLGDASVLTGGNLNSAPIADSHGIWLSGGAGSSGIYLYTGHAMQWVANIGAQLAGECS